MNTTTTPPPRDEPAGNTNPAPPTDAASAGNVPAAPPKYLRPGPASVVLMALVALIGVGLILAAWKLWPFASEVVSTDNAYVRGPVTVLAPQVSGYVTEVLVGDYDRVKAGEPLVRIDDRINTEKVQLAQAQLDDARARLANAKQATAQDLAEVDAAQARLASAGAERTRVTTELARYEKLAEDRLIAVSDRDRLRTAVDTAAAGVRSAQAEIRIAEETVKATRVSRKGLEAQVEVAQAQLDLARIDLANTVIRAPRDGQVGEASVRVGQYVAAGSQLLFLVPDDLWVVANFKEGQTWKIRIGQPATFLVDAFQGERLEGVVEEIAPATGSEFSVLRPDNASGNFTKVVQRLPVRIRIKPGQELARRLRPGMSVVVKVDTGVKRPPDAPRSAPR